MNNDIEFQIVKLLKERRSKDFIVIACRYSFNYDVTDAEIEAIFNKHNIQNYREEEEKRVISELSTGTAIAWLEYLEARLLYNKMFTAFNGFDKKISPEAASGKICSFYKMMFDALNKYQKLKKDSEKEIINKYGEPDVGLFRKVNKIVEERKNVSAARLASSAN
jgi:hypothetical protein